jgi:CheY-like chemotaxis protein
MKTDILLIEDSQEDADLMIRVIKQENPATKVKVIYDGADALSYLFDNGFAANSASLPKVIFLDIKLPRLNGPQILRKLRESELTSTIPVVIMTSSNQQADIDECYRLGANSYLVKPIDFPSFQKMILSSARYWLNYNMT